MIDENRLQYIKLFINTESIEMNANAERIESKNQ